jgi:Domain of Unknown Function (DUF1080)
MKFANAAPFILVTLALSSLHALAGKDADLKPSLAKPGAVIAEDGFSDSAPGKSWTIAKGTWVVKDGALVGAEKAEDKHAAVLTLAKPNHNSILRFSFKLDGTDGLALSFNHAKGHLFRIAVSPTGIAANMDKDKKDPKSKALPLGKAAGKFERGQWYTMLVEVQGSRIAVQTDNGVKLDASNPGIDVDKTGYRFVMRGASLLLDDVKAWEALP